MVFRIYARRLSFRFSFVVEYCIRGYYVGSTCFCFVVEYCIRGYYVGSTCFCFPDSLAETFWLIFSLLAVELILLTCLTHILFPKNF